MNLAELRSTLDRHCANGTSAWPSVFSLGQRGLLDGLAEGLRTRSAELPRLRVDVPRWFQSRPYEIHLAKAFELYAGVAEANGAKVSVSGLVSVFGAGPVADVQVELEGARTSPQPYSVIRCREIERGKRDPLWPWKARRPAHTVEVPVVPVITIGTNELEGPVAWLRFDWVARPEAAGEGHVYLAPAQMAVQRTRPPWYQKPGPSWWEGEVAILDFVAGRLSGRSVNTLPNGEPVPYVLPLARNQGALSGGDLRWWMTLENGMESPLWSGDSFGLAYMLGLMRLLAKVGVKLPKGWGELAQEELMTGVLGMAAVDRAGNLKRVGLTHEKIKTAVRSFIGNGPRTIHTVIVAREQEDELRARLELDQDDWLGAEREMRFLFAGTVDEAIGKVGRHLEELGTVERAIRRYGDTCEAEWQARFAEEGQPGPTNLPPYVETQGLRLLEGGAEELKALGARSFEMPREEKQDGEAGPAPTERWRLITREDLLDRLCGFAEQPGVEQPWPAPPVGETDSLRMLCITHDAGQGKTELLRWLQRELRGRLPFGYWVVLTRAKELCRNSGEVVRRLASQLGLGRKQGVMDDLEERLGNGQVVFLIDGLDEVPQGARTEALATLIQQAWPNCRFVVAGRPHAIWLHWDPLFQVPGWRFLKLDYFTEEDQKRYLDEELFGRVTETIEAPKELLAVPRALYYVRRLAGKSPEELARIRTPSDVYLHAVKEMVTYGVKAKAARGIAEEAVMELLSAIAFEMVAGRNFEAIERGGMDEFLSAVARRCGEYQASLGSKGRRTGRPRRDLAWCRRELRRVASMNEMLNGGLLERGCPERIQWRNRSLQEFFAGFWLANYCVEQDQARLRGMLHIDQEVTTHDYRWMWRFLGEMPEAACARERWVRALEPVYLPDAFPVPKGGTELKRSTEVIWRTWERMERDGKGVIEQFCTGFREILVNPSHLDSGIAEQMLRNLVRCHLDPKDEPRLFQMGSLPVEKGRYDDELWHSVRMNPFWMGKYVVTEEEYRLFEPASPMRFGVRFPRVGVTWYDGWVFARWAGCRLPTEAEWEYACRSGTATAYSFGDSELRLSKYAWCHENSGYRLHQVGRNPANDWGLYDMHGLVWEWCDQWYGDYSIGVVRAGEGGHNRSADRERICRGGSYLFDARHCRSAYRGKRWPGATGEDIGLRLVSSAVPEGEARQQRV